MQARFKITLRSKESVLILQKRDGRKRSRIDRERVRASFECSSSSVQGRALRRRTLSYERNRDSGKRGLLVRTKSAKKRTVWDTAKGRQMTIDDGDEHHSILSVAFGEDRIGSSELLPGGDTNESNANTVAFNDDGDESKKNAHGLNEKRIDRGLGQRRALSAETRSRPFVPLGGEILHLCWLREYDETGKFTKEEGEAYRETIKDLLSHYTTPAWKVTSVLDGIARGWSDVVLDLGDGFNCRLQRHTEFETLTLSGPGRLNDAIEAPIKPWSWLLPTNWLADIPGKVFLIQHFVVRLDKETFAGVINDDFSSDHIVVADTGVSIDDLQRSRSLFEDFNMSTDANSRISLRQLEAARTALASRVVSRDSSYFEDRVADATSAQTSTKGSTETFRDSELDWEVGAFAGAALGDGAKIYVNYQLDEDGGTQCLVTVPPGKESFDRTMRQIQRLMIIEQYRLLILSRLPKAKAKRQSLAQLQIQYDNVSSVLRKSRASNTNYRNQQEMLTQVADLESAVADVVAKTKMLALSAQAYNQIIELKFNEAQFKRLSYSARFLPLFVKKRLDPALSTIFFASEQAEILSAALSRTTNLIQAAVEVKLQRLNESIALYGLIFTVASVGLGIVQAWRIGNLSFVMSFTKTLIMKTCEFVIKNFGHLFEHFHYFGLA